MLSHLPAATGILHVWLSGRIAFQFCLMLTEIPHVWLHSAPIHSYSIILDELLSYLPAAAGIPHVWLSGQIAF